MTTPDQHAPSRLLADCPTNWGRWGAEDELGALNFLTADYWEPGPTVSPDLVMWFHRMEIPCLVTDTLANETTYEPNTGIMLPLHGALMRNLGIVFTEAAWLDDIAADCAADRHSDGLFCASPIRLALGTGSSVNPIVLKRQCWLPFNEWIKSMTTEDAATRLCFLPATELAARIRRRDLSPVEVVGAYLRRIEQRNPLVNAYTLVLADRAMDAARAAERAVMAGGPLGPLHGVPVAIKDLDDVAGVPTSMGSLAVRDYVPGQSAAAVERLLRAGAIVLGKTNSPEFGHKGVTDNRRFGPTSTPYAIGFNAGGSSGGSAAAVADGLAALGQGTDGGGSVRIPASFSGAVGFKASFGRVASVTRPDGFLWDRPFVHIGPLARTVADAALMTQVMAGPHPRDPLSLPDDATDFMAGALGDATGLRIAYSRRLGNFPVDPRVASVIDNAVAVIAAHGFGVDDVEMTRMPHHGTLAALWVRTAAIHYGAIAEHLKADGLDLLGDHADELTPEFRAMLESAGRVSAVEHRLDDVLRTQVFDAAQDVLETHDIIVAPTLAVPPVRNTADGNTLGPKEINGEAVDPLIGWCMTFPINYTGHPAISVPAGLSSDGLPVGLQIIGRRHQDATVLAMAAAFERMQPWFHTYPGLAC